jgi:dienelactone hydrolase
MKWLPKHTPEHTGKRVRKVIDGLKEQGIIIYGATGYCYGGTILAHGFSATLTPFVYVKARLSFDLAFDNIIQAVALAHPSFFQPQDYDVRHL